MDIIRIGLAVCALTSLSACLNNDIQRGLAGAAAGAVLAETIGGDPLSGAVAGGAAGALCDDLTAICR